MTRLVLAIVEKCGCFFALLLVLFLGVFESLSSAFMSVEIVPSWWSARVKDLVEEQLWVGADG